MLEFRVRVRVRLNFEAVSNTVSYVGLHTIAVALLETPVKIYVSWLLQLLQMMKLLFITTIKLL